MAQTLSGRTGHMCPFFGLPFSVNSVVVSLSFSFCLTSPPPTKVTQKKFFSLRLGIRCPFSPSFTCYLPLGCSANRSGNENGPPCSVMPKLLLEIVS